MPQTTVRTGHLGLPSTLRAEPPSSTTSTTFPGPAPKPPSSARVVSPENFPGSYGSMAFTRRSLQSLSSRCFLVAQTFPTTLAMNINSRTDRHKLQADRLPVYNTEYRGINRREVGLNGSFPLPALESRYSLTSRHEKNGFTRSGADRIGRHDRFAHRFVRVPVQRLD